MKTGVIVIGRNEGERLRACFESIKEYIPYVVYVDSGSTDDSLETANEYGIESVSLDMSVPFSAGRARNEGVKQLLSSHPDVSYIQFVDGDCTVDKNWITTALKSFEDNTAIICGRRKEKYPDATIYNQLCDIEWNTPVGEARACGGDFLIKTEVFQQHNGFNPSVIAGEEPELCYRIRESGYTIQRIAHDMTYHDADIHHFRQHWMRSVRCGYAYALGLYLHHSPAERLNLKPTLSALFWGGFIPLVILLSSLWHVYFLFAFAIYPLNILKIYLRMNKDIPIPLIYSCSLIIGKFSETYGILKFIKTLITSDKHKIIEYK